MASRQIVTISGTLLINAQKRKSQNFRRTGYLDMSGRREMTICWGRL